MHHLLPLGFFFFLTYQAVSETPPTVDPQPPFRSSAKLCIIVFIWTHAEESGHSIVLGVTLADLHIVG